MFQSIFALYIRICKSQRHQIWIWRGVFNCSQSPTFIPLEGSDSQRGALQKSPLSQHHQGTWFFTNVLLCYWNLRHRQRLSYKGKNYFCWHSLFGNRLQLQPWATTISSIAMETNLLACFWPRLRLIPTAPLPTCSTGLGPATRLKLRDPSSAGASDAKAPLHLVRVTQKLGAWPVSLEGNDRDCLLAAPRDTCRSLELAESNLQLYATAAVFSGQLHQKASEETPSSVARCLLPPFYQHTLNALVANGR